MMIDINNLNHEAIYRAYPNVVQISDGYGAFDQDGNQVELEEAVIDAVAESVRLERAWQFLREKRDRLIAETDWVVSRAVDASNDGLGIQLPQVWVDYRQALRDLPANTTDPANPVWPTKP